MMVVPSPPNAVPIMVVVTVADAEIYSGMNPTDMNANAYASKRSIRYCRHCNHTGHNETHSKCYLLHAFHFLLLGNRRPRTIPRARGNVDCLVHDGP